MYMFYSVVSSSNDNTNDTILSLPAINIAAYVFNSPDSESVSVLDNENLEVKLSNSSVDCSSLSIVGMHRVSVLTFHCGSSFDF